MNNKINKIITEELRKVINEVFDTYGGSIYQPPGLDPTHVKLFENIDDLYHSSLDDDYWKEISKSFPGYNSGSGEDYNNAVDHILSGMKSKYPDQNWGEIEKSMRDKIGAGIS